MKTEIKIYFTKYHSFYRLKLNFEFCFYDMPIIEYNEYGDLNDNIEVIQTENKQISVNNI